MLEREKEKRHQLRESHIQHDSDDPSNSVDYEQINREKTDAYKRTLCMLLEDACKATQETTFELCKAVLLANANDSDVQMSADFRYALAAEAARLSNLAQSGLQSLTREESDALFAKLDANSDGQLSYREIRKGLSNIKESTGLVQTAQQILSGADVDNDSRVDAAEFYFCIARHFRVPPRHVASPALRILSAQAHLLLLCRPATRDFITHAAKYRPVRTASRPITSAAAGRY